MFGYNFDNYDAIGIVRILLDDYFLKIDRDLQTSLKIIKNKFLFRKNLEDIIYTGIISDVIRNLNSRNNYDSSPPRYNRRRFNNIDNNTKSIYNFTGHEYDIIMNNVRYIYQLFKEYYTEEEYHNDLKRKCKYDEEQRIKEIEEEKIKKEREKEEKRIKEKNDALEKQRKEDEQRELLRIERDKQNKIILDRQRKELERINEELDREKDKVICNICGNMNNLIFPNKCGCTMTYCIDCCRKLNCICCVCKNLI
jgi:hypothetical protein